MQIIELKSFSRDRDRLLTEGEYRTLQLTLLEHPTKGDVIVGTAGARKIRVALAGRGKGGGARVIYVYFVEAQHIYLLLIYDKHDKESLDNAQKNTLKRMIETLED